MTGKGLRDHLAGLESRRPGASARPSGGPAMAASPGRKNDDGAPMGRRRHGCHLPLPPAEVDYNPEDLLAGSHAFGLRPSALSRGSGRTLTIRGRRVNSHGTLVPPPPISTLLVRRRASMRPFGAGSMTTPPCQGRRPRCAATTTISTTARTATISTSAIVGACQAPTGKFEPWPTRGSHKPAWRRR